MYPQVHAGLFRQYRQEERSRAMSGRCSGSLKNCWGICLPTSETEEDEKTPVVMDRGEN